MFLGLLSEFPMRQTTLLSVFDSFAPKNLLTKGRSSSAFLDQDSMFLSLDLMGVSSGEAYLLFKDFNLSVPSLNWGAIF